MGKKWDYDVPSVEIWKECLRVLKPGGHLLAFGGTRTYHRLAVNVEDAGFEIRDQIQWLYGQGFPKSLDVSKAIDKAAGAVRPVIGTRDPKGSVHGNAAPDSTGSHIYSGNLTSSEGQTDAAKLWEGWGTALKPANEPIVLARKPLEKGLTVAQNVMKWGTGAINIDGCRIATSDITGRPVYDSKGWKNTSGKTGSVTDDWKKGRFPANVILDEVAAEMLDEQTQHLHGAGFKRDAIRECAPTGNIINKHAGDGNRFGDSGGASRFFYCAKASTSERNAGLDGMPLHQGPIHLDGGPWTENKTAKSGEAKRLPRQNFHPTVKPVKLMEYLVRLITPPGGIVLDPFMGSGTTGIAAKMVGVGFVGIEIDSSYFNIAKMRIESWVLDRLLEVQERQIEMPSLGG